MSERWDEGGLMLRGKLVHIWGLKHLAFRLGKGQLLEGELEQTS